MVKNSGFTSVLISLCVLFAAAVSLTDQLNSVALYAAIPIAFLLSVAHSRILAINNYFRLYIYLCLWLLVTSFFAIDTNVAFREMRQVLGAFLLSYIVSASACNDKTKPWMYMAFITLYLSAIFYANIHILYVGWDISGNERANDEVLNANKLAYYTFYATIAFYILAELITSNRIINKSFRVLFLAMIPLSFWIALVTASRQVLIIQIPTIVILGYIRYFRGNSAIKTIIPLLLVIGVAIFAARRVENIYNDSYLAARNEISLSEDTRPKLMANAIQVGLEHPFVGVGPGNFGLISFNKHYSHCTYTELFANTGLLGFILYAVLVFKLLITNYRRYRKTNDLHYMVFACFALMFIAYNFFYVFYKDIWLTSFFFLVASDSENYYRRAKKIPKTKYGDYEDNSIAQERR